MELSLQTPIVSIVGRQLMASLCAFLFNQVIKPMVLHFDDLVISGLTPSNFTANDPNTSDQALYASGLGFFGGVDASTALFYSAGAALGVIGANLESDPDAEAAYGGTSFLEDPANFVTDEFQNQYGLGRIKAQYAYARGHTGSGVLVSVMDSHLTQTIPI